MDDGTGRKPLRSARDRFEDLHRILRDRICELVYAPGMRLSETALAAEFGISRTPLRRVLARLESEGLLRSVHGVGTIVTDLDRDELAQIYRLRVGLTGLLVSVEPAPPGPALVARMHELAVRAHALVAAPTPEGFTRLNRDVFLALLDLTANRPLREISEQLYFRTTRIWLNAQFAARIDLASECAIFAREVDDILAALERGDIAAVAALRRAHLVMSFERLGIALDPGAGRIEVEPGPEY